MLSGLLTSKLLPVPHGFSTRQGGVSPPPYDSLNLSTSTGDTPEHVRENLARLVGAVHLSPQVLAGVRQVHGDRVLEVAADPWPSPEPEADGLWTQAPGRGVGVKTADCVPILIVDPVRRKVAAVHSGWRGTRARIAARAVERLVASGSAPGDLLAAIGPAIGRCCYVVSPDLAQTFRVELGEEVVGNSAQGPCLDLVRAVRQTLVAAGVRGDRIDALERCTACEKEVFYSHRRDGAATGRHLSFAVCVF